MERLYVKVCPVRRIPVGLSSINVEGVSLLIINTDSGYVVLNNTCPHKGASLVQGEKKDDSIICPWHHAQYSLFDGHVEKPPEVSRVGIINRSIKMILPKLIKYETKIEDDTLYIKGPLVKQKTLTGK